MTTKNAIRIAQEPIPNSRENLDRLIEVATGQPTAAQLNPEPATETKKKRSKPGVTKVVVYLSDNDYHNLVESADGRQINEWLSRIIAGRVGVLAEECLDTRKAR